MSSDPLIGTTIRGYRLTRLIGRGAMGMVYAAEHEDSGLKVAVKFLSGEYSSKKEFVARFMHEAEACSAMQHENLMRVFEAGEHEGVYFMVMEFVDGIDLAHFLDTQERVKESQALPWLKQTSQALAYAHAHGIVHRDLKPENIMLTREGVVKLADLGLSKRLDADENLSMTLSGTVIGTPYYISPEQTKNAKRVDARTDIYSLGATFYHLLTGRPPFNGHSAAEVMAKHMNEPLVPPQRVNVALSDHVGDLLCKMMEKDPDKRFPSMNAILEAIERVERGEAPIARTVRLKRNTIPALAAPPAPAESPKPQSKLPMIAGGVFGLVALVALGAWFLSRGGARPALPPPKVAAPAPAAPAAPAPPPEAPAHPPPAPAPTAAPEVSAAHPPPAVEPKAHGGEEEVLRVGGGGPAAVAARRAVSFRLVDALGLMMLAVGVIVARHHGFRSSCFRAVAVWVGLGCAVVGTGPFAAWLSTALVLPPAETPRMAFVLVSAVALVVAWTMTHPFGAREKEHWTAAVGRFLAVIPGLVIGAALAFWAFALMAFISAADFGVRDSWVGSRVIAVFPALEKAVDTQLKAKQ
jgi:serine/threonine-protein kinase